MVSNALSIEDKKDDLLIARNPNWALGETQNPLTGYVGLATIALSTIALVAFHDGPISKSQLWGLRQVVVVALVFFSMAAVELLVFKIHKRNFDLTLQRVLDKPAFMRVLIRTVAFYVCLALAGCVFFLMNIYLPGFMLYFSLLLPLIVICSPIYFVLVEKYSTAERDSDEFLLMADAVVFMLGAKHDKTNEFEIETDPAVLREHMFNLGRGLLIKGFFIPFMVMSCITMLNILEKSGYDALHSNIGAIGSPEFAAGMPLVFIACFQFLIVVDTTIAMLGYLTSSRLLDTQFVSAEPTLLGWFVALICYPPFNVFFEGSCLQMAYTSSWPKEMFAAYPVISIVASALIVVLMAVYSWSTVMFGLRFSNLTNRGIICSGPYKFVRHPAYIGKNCSWWIALIPAIILGSANWMLAVGLLAVLNLTYTLRALTEERHLMRENHYVEYMKRVRWRFIPGIW